MGGRSTGRGVGISLGARHPDFLDDVHQGSRTALSGNDSDSAGDTGLGGAGEGVRVPFRAGRRGIRSPPQSTASLWIADPNPRAQAFYRKHRFDFDGAGRVESGMRELRMARTTAPAEGVGVSAAE